MKWKPVINNGPGKPDTPLFLGKEFTTRLEMQMWFQTRDITHPGLKGLNVEFLQVVEPGDSDADILGVSPSRPIRM